ncbi:MAG: Ig-like domain-containing protein, partial [Pirellulales bacterium]
MFQRFWRRLPSLKGGRKKGARPKTQRLRPGLEPLEVRHLLAVTSIDLVAGSDTGSSDADNITSDNTPAFIGTAAPLLTVTVRDGAIGLGTTSSDLLGNWSFTSPVLADGTRSISADDGLGALSLSVTIDTTAPAAPSVPDLDAASDSGSSDTDNITAD